MDLGLTNKIALIIGASKGLGYATAKTLSSEGARIAINSRNATTLEEAAKTINEETGGEVICIPGDVTQADFAGVLIDKTLQHFGGLDILITNAGGPPSGKFESFNDEIWAKAIELSFMSHVRIIRAALPALQKSISPSVLTITSYSVKQPIPNLILSNSIRAATAGLTKSLALELGQSGIRFNSILPGWTQTERVKQLMQNRAITNSSTIDEEIHKQAQEIALRRLATPDEFARVAAFLVSPAASYVTGVQLNVDGGVYKGLF